MDFAAGDSSLFVNMVQVSFDTDFHFVAQLLVLSGEGSAHSQNDFGIRYSPESGSRGKIVLAAKKRSQRSEKKTNNRQSGDASQGGDPPGRTKPAARGGV